MSEEQSGGSGLKNAIIGLVTIIVTAIAGVVGKKVMGGDEAPAPAAASAPAPNIIINNSQTQSGGKGGSSAAPPPAPASKPAPKKDDWTKAEPKW